MCSYYVILDCELDKTIFKLELTQYQMVVKLEMLTIRPHTLVDDLCHCIKLMKLEFIHMIQL